MSQTRCIWCLQEGGEPADEHFWPASLGGDDDAILPAGCVCRSCNNRFGILDQRLGDELDLFLLDAGVSRRGGKPPVVANRGNAVGWMGPDGPCLEANLSREPIQTRGRTLAPPGKSRRTLQPKIERMGDRARIQLTYELSFDRHFVRALYKIGLGALCFVKGAVRAVEPRYAPVRDFVREDRGDRRTLVVGDNDSPGSFGLDGIFDYVQGEIVGIKLGKAHFLVDLGPDEQGIELLARGAEERSMPAQFFPL